MEVVPGLHWVDAIWDTKVYVLCETDRVVVIDAAMPGRAGAVWRYLDFLGYPPEAVDEIWLTHADIDHMGSVGALKERSGAKVIVHGADAPLVEGQMDRQLGQVALARTTQMLFNWAVRQVLRYQPTTVDRAVADGDDLEGWRVVHAPGHTAGSACFYHPGRELIIVGDALNHRRGRLGAPPRMFTPDMAAAYTSIRRIAELDLQVCCFGHGPPLLKGAGRRVREFADSLRPEPAGRLSEE
jgi:glyoxylase-like metal-dependent hydrolase (beta-lactamase superfamily II)